MDNIFDLIVIGAGPGGYVSAIKASQLGMNVAVIENKDVGGTCLNRGCIPTKTLIHVTELLKQMQSCQDFGINIESVKVDIDKIYEHKKKRVKKLRTSIEQLFKTKNITLYKGKGKILDSETVNLYSEEDTFMIKGKKIIIATGSVPSIPPIKGIELCNVLTSDDLLSEKGKLYKDITIIGGGVISVEFASIFNVLGSKVTIIEAMPSILPAMDKEISQNLKMILKKRGIEIFTDAKV